MTLLQHHLIALALIGFMPSALGLFILSKNPSKFLNRIFALYMFSVSWWSLWELWGQFSPNESVAVIRLRTEYFGACFIPTLFFHFAATLAGFRRRWELATFYVLSIIFTVLIAILRHPLLLPDAVPVAYLPYWGRAGPLYFLFVSFFGIAVIRTHHILWQAIWREKRHLQRRQLQSVLFSSALAYTAAIPEFSLKFGVQIPFLSPFGLYSVPLHALLIALAIVQFSLFDIRVVIRKSLVYSILVTLLTVGYFGLMYSIEQAFKNTLGYQSIWISLAAFALMALLFQPLKLLIQRWVDWLILRAPHEEIVKRMERLEKEAGHVERLRAIATMAAGMAHEIKSPLTAMKTFAEFVPERHADPKFAKKLHEVFSQETNRIQRIVQDVLDFAKPKPPQLKSVDIGSLLSSTLDLLSNELLKCRVKWTVDCQHNGATFQADPDQLRQVLINLIQNAAEAMSEGGTLTLATRVNNGHLELVVSDTGQGIPKELLPKIFDPFVTTKPHGNGLGLAMVCSIIQAHRGTIHATSEPGKGTTFTISLPID